MAKKKNKNLNIKTDKANINVDKNSVAVKVKGKKKVKVPTKIAVSIVAVLLVIAMTGVICYYFVAPFKAFIDDLFGITTIPTADGELNVHFVDIGQGDFIIIQLPDGKNMIIDAGSDAKGNRPISGSEIVNEKIEELKITTFDYMLLTHTDGDHVDYMDDVLAKCKVLNIYRPMFLSKTEKVNNPNSQFASIETNTYDDFVNAVNLEVETEGARVFMNNDTVEPIVGAGYKIEFYNVAERAYYKTTVGEGTQITAYEKNAVSPITILTFKGENQVERSIAFTGDAEGKDGSDGNGGELDFIEKYRHKKIDVDVIKAGHHGSSTSTSIEIMDFLDPEYCVVSVGTTQKHGHPTTEFISRVTNYTDKNLTDDNDGILGLYMTKDKGDIVLNINKQAVMNWNFQINNAA